MDDTDRIILTVWRNFKNREQKEPDDGPLAQAAHRRRQEVMGEACVAMGREQAAIAIVSPKYWRKTLKSRRISSRSGGLRKTKSPMRGSNS
jgi:hypothetical protein